jgi:zinc transporter
MSGHQHEPRPAAALPDGAGLVTVLVFDGQGGVVRHDAAEAPPAVPPGGFLLIAGNPKSPQFAPWLQSERAGLQAELLLPHSTRTHCAVVDDTAVLVLRVAGSHAHWDNIERQVLTLLIERDRVVIASELDMVEFLKVAKWESSHHAPVSPAELVARVGRHAADHLEGLIEHVADKLDDVEKAALSNDPAKARSHLAHLRRAIISYRRLVWPQREVFGELELEDVSFFTPEDRQRLREASARAARIGEELTSLSERAVLVHEQITDSRAEQMNQTMLILTAVNLVFMPPTLLTGLLGVNVAGIPFAQSPYAFWVVCVLLLAMILGIIWWMHERRWL